MQGPPCWPGRLHQALEGQAADRGHRGGTRESPWPRAPTLASAHAALARALPAWASALTALQPLPQQAAPAAKAGATEQVKIAVLGASGYTGEEVVRLLALHPNFKVTVLTGDRQAGKVRGRCRDTRGRRGVVVHTCGQGLRRHGSSRPQCCVRSGSE